MIVLIEELGDTSILGVELVTKCVVVKTVGDTVMGGLYSDAFRQSQSFPKAGHIISVTALLLSMLNKSSFSVVFRHAQSLAKAGHCITCGFVLLITGGGGGHVGCGTGIFFGTG